MASRTPLLALRAARAVRAPVRSLAVSARQLQEPSVAPFKEPVGVNPAKAVAGVQTALHEYGQYILTSLPRYVQQFSVYKDELTLYIPPQAVIPVFTFLRDHTQCQYRQVVDITAVDFPTKPNRFEVRIPFLIPPRADPSPRSSTTFSPTPTSRASALRRMRTRSPLSPPSSVCSTAPTGTNVRYGICMVSSSRATLICTYRFFFCKDDNSLIPARRRILTDYGFEGFPLRKDFPLTVRPFSNPCIPNTNSSLYRATQRSDTMTKRSESSMNPFNSPRRLETLTMPLLLGSKSVVVIPRSNLKSTKSPRPQSPRRRKSKLEEWVGFHMHRFYLYRVGTRVD